MNDPGLKAASFSVKSHGNPLAFSLISTSSNNATVEQRARTEFFRKFLAGQRRQKVKAWIGLVPTNMNLRANRGKSAGSMWRAATKWRQSENQVLLGKSGNEHPCWNCVELRSLWRRWQYCLRCNYRARPQDGGAARRPISRNAAIKPRRRPISKRRRLRSPCATRNLPAAVSRAAD